MIPYCKCPLTFASSSYPLSCLSAWPISLSLILYYRVRCLQSYHGSSQIYCIERGGVPPPSPGLRGIIRDTPGSGPSIHIIHVYTPFKRHTSPLSIKVSYEIKNREKKNERIYVIKLAMVNIEYAISLCFSKILIMCFFFLLKKLGFKIYYIIPY